MRLARLPDSWRTVLAEALPVAPFAVLAFVWIIHDGGYDEDTWYWGALALLAVFAAAALAGRLRLPAGRLPRVALGAFAGYTAFSYLSIAWAGSPGVALTGSNKCLLYLLAFALLCLIAPTPRTTLMLLVTLAIGVGVVGLVVLLGLAQGHISGGFPDGRLVRPTNYFNATAALFTTQALLAGALGARRELSWLLRAVLLATATVSLQLALLCESRGWLFTLPLVLLVAVVWLRDRLELAWVVPPLAGVLAVLSPTLDVFKAYDDAHPYSSAMRHAVEHAARGGLVAAVAVLLVCAALTAAVQVRPLPSLGASRRRLVGWAVAIVVVLVAAAGFVAATHGHPTRFISRQWNGFIHPPANQGNAGSHFGQVGSGRYDFWRVGLDGFVSHPIGGLGQDNFADYYVPRRHTLEEPSWVHSLWVRLLTHTGLVGTLLFGAFLIAALLAAWRARRGPMGWIFAIAVIPLIDWLVHGSLDWFWEMPALAAPALGLLGAAVAGSGRSVAETPPTAGADPAPTGSPPEIAFATPVRARWWPAALAVPLVLAATAALAFPYLSVRYTSRASDEQTRNPVAALSDLRTAARLNPLDSTPPRLAGAIALRNGLPNVAASRFAEAIDREPGGWFNWFGAGLAASTLGDATTARTDLIRAEAINAKDPAVREALSRVSGAHPLTPAEAFRLLVVVQ